MTWKDLQKLIQSSNSSSDSVLEQLSGKPFWIWSREEHKQEYETTNGYCCFNHIIGLPTKNKKQYPLFDYEKTIYEVLQDHKHVWIKKATGLGITELLIRYMAYLCLYDSKFKDTQMGIITGPRIDLAIGIIRRIKKLFEPLGVYFDSKETVLELNGCRIEAFPSHNIDAFRSLPNVSFILLDEADFFPVGQQQDVRDVSERYIAKSNPYIVMISTPNAPGGLFETIENELSDTCLYHRIKLDYTFGLGKIYNEDDIKKAKQSPSFEREYNLKYVGVIGNVFHTQDIQGSITDQYETVKINPYSERSMGIDPGYGSSPFGIVITEYEDQKIFVKYAEDFERPDFNDMLNLVLKLYNEYRVKKIYVDGANASFIRSLKTALSERKDYEKIPKDEYRYMKVIPIAFSTNHRSMLVYSKQVLEGDYIRIHPKFEKLIISLNTAIEEDGKLDKDRTLYNDVYDAFRLALIRYQPQQYRGPEM